MCPDMLIVSALAPAPCGGPSAEQSAEPPSVFFGRAPRRLRLNTVRHLASPPRAPRWLLHSTATRVAEHLACQNSAALGLQQELGRAPATGGGPSLEPSAELSVALIGGPRRRLQPHTVRQLASAPLWPIRAHLQPPATVGAACQACSELGGTRGAGRTWVRSRGGAAANLRRFQVA